jgi:hypothetical protein
MQMQMQTQSNRRHFLALAAGTLICGSAPAAIAAGRTYKSQNEDDSPKLELCRLRRREYADGGTNCIYRRQSGGKDAVIRVDEQKVRCQAEYQCKRID